MGCIKSDGRVELARGPQFATPCTGVSIPVPSNMVASNHISFKFKFKLTIQFLCCPSLTPGTQQSSVSSGYHTGQYRTFPPIQKVRLDSSGLDKISLGVFPPGQGQLISDRARQQSRPLCNALVLTLLGNFVLED